ncbi:SRPBCC family protein [Streptomyces sp. NPDC005576]|uniref:SRPBCC family protein n=1 Tax=unclassified Streptomyces TaxID=2593676 RepID=UPI0033F33F4D
MRHVELESRIPSERAGTVYEAMGHWEKYPDLAPHVNKTEVHAAPPSAECSSSWELHFRSGLLRWTERDDFRPDALEIGFEQTDGDFDSFTGTWTMRQDGDEVVLTFEADFDFGIPSLEGILDPIAERVIRETVAWAVLGLFPAARLIGENTADIAPPDALTV